MEMANSDNQQESPLNGNPYSAPQAAVGNSQTNGMAKCISCGAEIPKLAGVCMSCGMSQRKRGYKNKNAAGVLAMFLGAFGIHRFYMGQWWGIFYLLTFWTLIPSVVSFVEAIVFWAADLRRWDINHNEGKPAGPTEQSSGVMAVVVAVILFFGSIFVIGIMAALALPAYQDYKVRQEVSIALVESAEYKSKITEYYVNNEQLPSQLSDIGIDSSILPSGNRINLSDSGYTITFINSNLSSIDGSTLEFQAYLDDDEGFSWDCTGGTLGRNYRLANCRPEN